jgi:outer membrane receptor protein involved in Fe transport
VAQLFSFDGQGKDNYRFRNGGKVEWEIYKNISWLNGVEFEERSTGTYRQLDLITGSVNTVLNADKNQESTFYTQVDYNHEQWRFLLGARLIDNTATKSEVTPRASVVYNIDHNQSIKALYSVGFNSPNFLQTGFNAVFSDTSATGNPSLVAERINAFDLAYTYAKKETLFIANVYYFEARNFINRSLVPVTTFKNETEFERRGVELDYQKAIGTARLFSNLAYQYEGNKILSADATAIFSPRWIGAMGFHLPIKEPHHLGASWRYTSERGTALEAHAVNVNYQFKQKDYQLFIKGLNILDKDIKNPDLIYSDTTLSTDGIGFLMGIQVQFR